MTSSPSDPENQAAEAEVTEPTAETESTEETGAKETGATEEAPEPTEETGETGAEETEPTEETGPADEETEPTEETGATEETEPTDEAPERHPLQAFADGVAKAVGGAAEIHFDTVKVRVAADSWIEAHQIARDELDLVFFSWLSAIDWSNEVEAGDPLEEEVEERVELLSALSDLTEGNLVIMSTDLPYESPEIPSLVEVYAGANWHERETYEMFGVNFEGHPNLIHLYLPDSFLGNPLRKSYPLLSREVKPWPGTVDVEAMPEKEEADEPSTENPEA